MIYGPIGCSSNVGVVSDKLFVQAMLDVFKLRIFGLQQSFVHTSELGVGSHVTFLGTVSFS